MPENHRLYLTAVYATATVMLLAGTAHFVKPQFYLPIVPDWLPLRTAIIYGSGVLEALAGVGLFFPRFRQNAALLVLALMCIFLPVHTWDVFRARPAMGSTARAGLRLLIQFLLIGGAWWLLQRTMMEKRHPLKDEKTSI